MAVAVGTGASAPISKAGLAATNTGASSSITTPSTNPVVMVSVYIWDSVGGTDISSLTITGFGGTASATLVEGFISGGQDMTLSQWVIVAPTASVAGTVQANFTGLVDYAMHIVPYSGAHQTTPCTVGNTVTDLTTTSPRTSTPTNLVTGDATHGASMNRAGGVAITAITPTAVITLQNSPGTDTDSATGYATDTTGATFAVSGGAGTFISIATRIAQAPSGGTSISGVAGATVLAGQGPSLGMGLTPGSMIEGT